LAQVKVIDFAQVDHTDRFIVAATKYVQYYGI